jgi:FAD/FMN-containing dehydrogenase
MATAICDDLLNAGLDGEVITVGRPDYDQRRRVWNGLFDRRPAAIVRARNRNDVIKTLRVAANHSALLAVRCGGHSLPGLSTCDGGIILDMSAFNGVTVDAHSRIAEVGGGALLGEVDRAGVPHGLVVPAGVVSHTGAAGLTLGGGMGFLSRRFGLTIDSLLGAELITADGRTVTTDAETEPELFWGIRGGGGNFGVVTKFRFRMHQLGSVLVGRWTYPRAVCAAVLRNYSSLAAAAPRQLTTSFTLTASNLSITAVWSGNPSGAEEVVSAFGALGRVETAMVGGQTFLELQSRSDDHFCWGRRIYAKGGFFAAVDDAVIACLEESIAESPTSDSEVYVLQLGGAIADINEDATAYSGRAAGFYWIVEPVWDDADDDARCMAWGRAVGKRMTAMSQAGNYVNEQGDMGNDIARSAYGADKYARLARLKARCDPTNLFRLNQNIEPRL